MILAQLTGRLSLLALTSLYRVSRRPPPGTSVTTSGNAAGNMVVNSTYNQTVHGAGGVTFQAGWTFVSGAWVGL